MNKKARKYVIIFLTGGTIAVLTFPLARYVESQFKGKVPQ